MFLCLTMAAAAHSFGPPIQVNPAQRGHGLLFYLGGFLKPSQLWRRDTMTTIEVGNCSLTCPRFQKTKATPRSRPFSILNSNLTPSTDQPDPTCGTLSAE
jgi:hypothetical protein